MKIIINDKKTKETLKVIAKAYNKGNHTTIYMIVKKHLPAIAAIAFLKKENNELKKEIKRLMIHQNKI